MTPPLPKRYKGFFRPEDENPYISPILFYTNLATLLQGKFMKNGSDSRHD
jgi:hypothetical protein